MFGRSTRAAGIVLAALMIVMVAAVPAFAASPAQQGTNSTQGSGTGTGANAWHNLAAGQTVEWVFDSTGSDNTATIELGMSPANSVAFNVFTDQQWTSGDTSIPIGKGTQRTSRNSDGTINILYNGDLFWTTGSANGQRFHIQVFTTGNQNAQYTITQSGPGAGGLAMFSAAAQTTAPSTTGQAMAQTTTTAPQGPQTLPVTGGSDVAPFFAAGLALIAGGWLMMRRKAL